MPPFALVTQSWSLLKVLQTKTRRLPFGDQVAPSKRRYLPLRDSVFVTQRACLPFMSVVKISGFMIGPSTVTASVRPFGDTVGWLSWSFLSRVMSRALPPVAGTAQTSPFLAKTIGPFLPG